MQSFMRALVTDYNGAEIGHQTNGLWFQEAPIEVGTKKIVRPYTIYEFTIEPSTAMNRTGHPHWEKISIVFSICSGVKSPLQVTTLCSLLIKWFDVLTNLGAAGYETIRIDRTGQELVPDPDKGWVYEVSYDVVLENEVAG